MIAGWIKRHRGTAAFRKTNDAVEVGVDDTGMLKFYSPDAGGITEATDNRHTQTVAGTKTFSGTNTHSGGNTFSGAVTFTGATVGVRQDVEILASGNKTVTAAMSGRVFVATLGSGTQTFTLPVATTVGLVYTFVCGDAAGEILVTPNAADTISIKASEGGANVTPAAGTGVKNTGASNVKNDHLTLVADGVSAWYTIAESGTWATQ